MKTTNLIIMALFLSLFSNCENMDQADFYYEDAPQHNAQADFYYEDAPARGNAMTVSNSQARPQTVQTELEMKAIRDPKTGKVTSYLPLPKDWKIITNPNGTQGFTAPNGVRVQGNPTETYYFNVDPYVAQMSGQKVSNPVAPETIFQSRIAPSMQQQGAKLLKQYNLSEIAQRSQQLLQNTLTRSRIHSVAFLASEWQKPNGQKSLVMLSYGMMQSQGGSAWWVGVTELQAPNSVFESAKKTYLFSQANWQVDRQTAMAHTAQLNQQERASQQMLAENQRAFNARMRSNEAAFQARQRTHRSTTEDISDISMRGYWNRAESGDRLRQKEVNMIHEENTMVNPWSQQNMQVRSGYQNYYINSNGNVIGSNNPNFNPNVNPKFNGTEWRKMPQNN